MYLSYGLAQQKSDTSEAITVFCITLDFYMETGLPTLAYKIANLKIKNKIVADYAVITNPMLYTHRIKI